MLQRSQVLRTLTAPCNGERLDRVLADDRWRFRTQIARAVCEEFGFVDARGEPQVSNGMVPDLVGLFFQDRLRSGPKIRFRHTF